MGKDYTTINNPKFLFTAELAHPFPDWVVNEEIPSAESFEKKASTAFADQKRRLLPISTKSATFHSAINLFAHVEDFDDDVFDRVKEACSHFDIESDIEPYVTLFAEAMEKSASENIIPEGRFAIDTTLGGEHFQLLPIDDFEDVRASARDLTKMASENRIHFLMFIPAAREIVKAAAAYGVEKLPEMITRLGADRFPDAALAQKLVSGRADLCKEASARQFLCCDYLEAIEGIYEDPDAAMEKIAAIDHAAGIPTNYRVSSSIPTPFEIVFAGPLVSEAEKAARENVLVRDVLIPLGAVKNIDDRDADFRLSKQASETFRKLKDGDDARDLSLAIETWHEDDQKTLLRMAVAA